MPAEIGFSGGRYNAMYVGRPAWHGLGEVVDQPKTPEEALAIAGTDFVVEKAPLVAVIDGKPTDVPEWKATYRTDTGQVLGVVSNDYRIVQNLEPMQMLMEIVRTKEAGIVAHAALGKGERLFAVLDLKALTDLRIPGDPSKIDPYVVAQWRHDGTGALTFGPSIVRVECANMARAQLAYAEDKGQLVRVVHLGNVRFAVDEARRVLGFAEQSIVEFVDLMTRLADVPIPTPEASWMDGFLEKLVPIPPEMERPVARTDAREAIAHLYRESSTMVGVQHTAYRVFNAVTEYADHYRPLRVSEPEKVPARRFATAVDGPAALLKSQAMSLLRQEFEV